MSKSKQIKDILVNLADTDQLPMDMYELDESIFDKVFAINEEELLQKAEKYALGQFLSDYSEDLDYDEIIEKLSQGDVEDILIWQPFENEDPSVVAERIQKAVDSTLELLKEIHNA